VPLLQIVDQRIDGFLAGYVKSCGLGPAQSRAAQQVSDRSSGDEINVGDDCDSTLFDNPTHETTADHAGAASDNDYFSRKIHRSLAI
jgi:hypothetical protein